MMSQARKFNHILVAALLTGPGYALIRTEATPAKAADRQEGGPASTQDKTQSLKPSPFTCRARLLGEAEQKASLKRHAWFERRPYLLTTRILQNPLIADILKVEVENTSGGKVGLYSERGYTTPFRLAVRIEDIAGQPVRFPHAGQSGIKRIGPIIGTNDPHFDSPIVSLRRGQVVVHKDEVWRYLNDRDIPSPGRYRVRVICSYFRAPDGQNIEVESAPLFITVTARDVRDWIVISELYDELRIGERAEEAQPAPAEPPVKRRK